MARQPKKQQDAPAPKDRVTADVPARDPEVAEGKRFTALTREYDAQGELK